MHTDISYDESELELHKLIDNLIDVNHKYCERFGETFMQHESPEVYVWCHRTVSINPGRGTGKTNYIIRNFNPHTDIVVTAHESHSHQIQSRVEKARGEKLPHIMFASGFLYKWDSPLAGRAPDAIKRVYVDEPHMVEEAAKMPLYDIISNIVKSKAFDVKNGTVILLGE